MRTFMQTYIQKPKYACVTEFDFVFVGTQRFMPVSVWNALKMKFRLSQQ